MRGRKRKCKANKSEDAPKKKVITLKEEVKLVEVTSNAVSSAVRVVAAPIEKVAPENNPGVNPKIPVENIEIRPGSPRTNDHLDRYRVVRILGKCEGVLYELEDLKDNTKAVLRTIRKSNLTAEDKEDMNTKMTNQSYTTELNHPNLIKFKDCWMDSTNFYYIEEYLEGKELLDYLQDVDLTEKVVVGILKKLISTSIYLTNSGFQFTDLKPHCVFVKDDGKSQTLKVTDFEYKSMFDKNSYSKNRYGSVYFVSPEVVEKAHNGDWLVWNCGAIVFLLLTGRQIHDEFAFKRYQDALKQYPVDLETKDFEEISEELMDLLEKMLNDDQFIRLSLVETNNHNVFLNKKYSHDEVNIIEPEEVRNKLKIFQGEMQMYSGMWGMIYASVVWEKRWVKKITKNLEKAAVNGKIPKEKLSEAYKFFTIEPALLEFHVNQIIEYLGDLQEGYPIKEVTTAMKQLDMDHYKGKIKDSFKYFGDSERGIDPDIILRVLKRTHPKSDSVLNDQISRNLTESGTVNYEGLVNITEFFLPK